MKRLITLAMLLLSLPAHAGDIKGLAEVIDGDTFRILNVIVRLWGIDAPELHQPGGREAKAYLEEITFGHAIHCEREGAVSYGRAVCWCWRADGQDIARLLVEAGHAVDWPEYSGGYYARPP